MPNITYSLGGTSFDAVPEELVDRRSLAVVSEATVARAQVHTVGIAGESIVLTGRYMTAVVRDAIAALLESCRLTGSTVVFNDGATDRDVLIRSFETVPLVGKTQGFSFRIELVVF